MMNRFLPGMVLAAGLAVLAGTNGCSSSDNPLNSVCCTDFQPGTDMASIDFGGDVSVKGQIRAFAQASGDMSALAGTAMADVTAACKNMAVDLGADPNDAAANGKTGGDLLTFWCTTKAVASIQASVSASVEGSISLAIQPPVCDVSVTAQASCDASCDVSGKCDVQANPPTCTGGQVEVSCSGTCTGSASAQIDCSGSCSGNCSGGCTAEGGVDCTGKCDGTCEAGGSTGGSGAQADGTCKGVCKGTCSVTAPNVKCSGSCSGKCDAECSPPQGQASVTCSAGCSDPKATPISCKGGKLEGGCQVDAKCQANCNASAQAKASCTPPSVTINAQLKAGADVQFAVLVKTLQTNLPALLLVIQAQGSAFLGQMQAVAQAGIDITGGGGLDVKSSACLVNMGASAASAVANFTTTLKGAASVTTSLGGPGM
ncbi:MAG TPA: hypothetical protein VF407_07500 [Polyangiaceae bacterium]